MISTDLMQVYKILLEHFGHQNWWPTISDNPGFEIIIGAILTQNASWKNVEIAVKNLYEKNKLSPLTLYNTDDNEIEKLIEPSGFFRVKAKRIRNFLNFLFEKYNGKMELLFELPVNDLRKELLSVNGIGKETADSIILYAAGKLKFVVDAYAIRIFTRLGLIKTSDYQEVQKFFEKNLPKSIKLFNEYHALIVEEGKNVCRPKPKCEVCPLNSVCNYYSKNAK